MTTKRIEQALNRLHASRNEISRVSGELVTHMTTSELCLRLPHTPFDSDEAEAQVHMALAEIAEMRSLLNTARTELEELSAEHRRRRLS